MADTTSMTSQERIHALLKEIKALLATENGERLWSILTALRGPDDDNVNLKACTTAVIRGIALGDGPSYVGATSAAETDETRKARHRYLYGDLADSVPWHFRGHINCAMDALYGLELMP